jgi:hypothetical protein
MPFVLVVRILLSSTDSAKGPCSTENQLDLFSWASTSAELADSAVGDPRSHEERPEMEKVTARLNVPAHSRACSSNFDLKYFDRFISDVSRGGLLKPSGEIQKDQCGRRVTARFGFCEFAC